MKKEVRYVLLIVLCAALVTAIPLAIGRQQALRHAQAQAELLKSAPSPVTSVFRRVAQGATEVRLYENVSELYSQPKTPDTAFLQGEPVLVLRGQEATDFVAALHFESLSQTLQPLKHDVTTDVPTLEFYRGSQRVAELRLFSFEHVRFYDPLRWRGDGHLNTESARTIMGLR